MEAEQLKKITGFFIEEAKEHLETIEQGVTHLQATIDDPEQVTEVYRGAHSIKGGAAMLELECIRKTAHRLEDYFKILKEHSVTVDSTLGGFLNPIYRGLQTLVADLEKNYKVSPDIEKQVMTTLDPLFEQTDKYLKSLLTPASKAQTVQEPPPNEDTQDLPDSGEFLDNLITSDFTLESNYQRDRYNKVESREDSKSSDLGVDELSTLANLFESDGTDMDQTLADTDSDLKLLSELTGGDFGNEDITSDREEVDDFLDQLMDSGEFEPAQTNGDSNEGLSFLDNFDLDSEETTSTNAPTELSSSLDSLEALFSEDAEVKPLPTSNGQNFRAATPPKKAHPEEIQGIGKETNHDLDSLFGDFGQSNPDLLDSQTPDRGITAEEDNLTADFDLGLGDFEGDSLESEEDSAALFEDLFATSASESTAEEDLADIFSENQNEVAATSPAATDSGLDDLLTIGNAAENPVSESLDDSSLDDLLEMSSATATEEVETAAQKGDREAHSTELDDLFKEVTPAVSPPEVAPVAKHPVPPNVSGAESPHYYDRIEELEQLLALSPSINANGNNVFTDLEHILNFDPHLENALKVDLTPETARYSGSDDEFGDLEELIQDIESKVPTTGVRTARSPRTNRGGFNKTKVEQTLKVPVKQMDNLSNLVGELVVNRNSLEGDEDKLRQSLDTLMHQVQNLSDVGGRMQDLYERSLLEDALLKSRQEYRSKYGNTNPNPVTEEEEGGLDVLEMDSFTKFHELAQEVIEMIVRVRESASDIALWVDDIDLVARTLRQVTSQLQEGLTKARMVPFARTADRLPLAVRKICPRLGKEAQLHVEGRETLIDKMILEHLSDPLTHLVNNALTHGIETPDERRTKGKPAAGQITVRALQQGNQTAIVVSDDGAGIDPRRIRQKAIEKGVITPTEASKLSELETYDLLFKAGFSTKDQADDFSGRGVGLDVVRNDITEIRGSVSIDSKLGKGTTFTIRLPLTLSICKALCCISENAPMAFPMDGVEDMVDIPLERIQTDKEGHRYVQWRDARLHYCPLSDLLTYNRKLGRGNIYAGNREDNAVSVVILRSATSFLAIGVDRVIGEQEIVIKQINGPVPKSAGIAGATVQGDGRIMAIADVMELIQIAEGRLRKDTASLWRENDLDIEQNTNTESTEPTVLIVDDSVTVRSLLSMTFEKAGYQVEQARDGQDAWDKLTGGLPCDLVFCDIEMPKMDGLELLERLQKEDNLKQIPVAMLTSRGAERHRRVAAESGACAYFTKPYVEQDLLEAARNMMNGEVLLEGSTRVPTPRSAGKSDFQSGTPPIVSPMTVQQTPPKVMIVDDSVTVRSLLSITFEKAGYEVEQARDGQDAWAQLQNGTTCDLAFLDIEMPKMDGLELLERIQNDENLKKIPVAMLTSRGAQKMQQRAAERGASAYFTKPYVEQELLDAAQALRSGQVLLQNSTRQASAPPPPKPEPEPPTAPPQDFPHNPRVLIVDDSVTVRSLLSMTFENAGYQVEQARDGKHALTQLQEGLEVDVAFLDIEMPKMDGLTLLAKLQEDEKFKNLPVAMLTSRGAERMKKRAADIGAKGYFVKPYVEEHLLEGAKQLIQGETGVGNWFD